MVRNPAAHVSSLTLVTLLPFGAHVANIILLNRADEYVGAQECIANTSTIAVSAYGRLDLVRHERNVQCYQPSCAKLDSLVRQNPISAELTL